MSNTPSMYIDYGRRTRRDAARTRIAEVSQHEDQTQVIHYSCEAFDNPDGTSPRITSLAIRNLKTAQTSSFSMHLCAEMKRMRLADIRERYDELERQMLDEFYDFVGRHANDRWIGWVMRDTKYGFPHIEHRYKVLGGAPIAIPDACKINLASLLIDLYGSSYATHPRLLTLMRLNSISEVSYLAGDEEPKAFVAGDYAKLHQSTLRKVDNMAYIYERVLQGRLQTSARFCVVDDALLAELPVRYWHCAAWDAADESAIDNDLSLDDLERRILLPWRSGKSFVLGGRVFQSRDVVKRVFVTCSTEPLAHFQAKDARSAAEHRARDEASRVVVVGGYTADSRFTALHAGDDHTSRLLFESFEVNGPIRSVPMPAVSTDVTNKLGSILFLDIVGWSKLTAAEIRAFVDKALPKLGDMVRQRSPWMVNTWGDAIVAVFDNATACAETALELCDFFGRAKASDGVAQGMSARVGVHVGEVFCCTNPITSKVDIFGPAVHTAARLEPVAAAGHAFCTSDFANRLAEVAGEAPRAHRIGAMDLAKGFGRSEIFVLSWPNAPTPHVERFQSPAKASVQEAATPKMAPWLIQFRRPFNALYALIDGSTSDGSLTSVVAFFSNFADGSTRELCKTWSREATGRLRILERWGVNIQALLHRDACDAEALLADLLRWLGEIARLVVDVAAHVNTTADAGGALNANAKRQLSAARDEIGKQFEKLADAHNAAIDNGLTALPFSVPKLARVD